MNTSFIILRRETVGGYSTRGPVAQPVTLREAQSDIVRLKKLFPYQDFVIMGAVGGVTRSERVTVRIDAPDLSEATPRNRRAPKAPETRAYRDHGDPGERERRLVAQGRERLSSA